MRSMDSILADEPSVHTLPDGPQSDSAPEPVEPRAEPRRVEKTEPDKVKASAKPATETVEDDDEGEENDPVDQSLEGLKKALTAVRGDKRTMRKKWREAERKAEDTARRIAQLEGQLTAYQQIGARPAQSNEPAKPQLPDFYGNPEEHLSAREKVLREEMKKAIRDEVGFEIRANISEALLTEQNSDYEDAKRAFMLAAQSDSNLWQKVAADPMPARVVYREGKKLLGNHVSEREAQLQAELDELKAKMAGGSVETSRPSVKPIPKSIASARGTGNGVPQAWNGPRSMKDILGH